MEKALKRLRKEKRERTAKRARIEDDEEESLSEFIVCDEREQTRQGPTAQDIVAKFAQLSIVGTEYQRFLVRMHDKYNLRLRMPSVFEVYANPRGSYIVSVDIEPIILGIGGQTWVDAIIDDSLDPIVVTKASEEDLRVCRIMMMHNGENARKIRWEAYTNDRV